MGRDDAIGPRRIGRYELYGAIAAGGMARVHFGRLLGPSGFSRTVAIKRLHPQLTQSEELVAMLLDEAKLVSRIQHPNVVATLDMVSHDGELFVVMDYVPGESLSRLTRLLPEGETVPLPFLLAIACGMLHGLHAAHMARSELDEPLEIVHRDVSPHNVLVGSDGLARVLDFGVAKARGRIQSTRAGQVKGKLSYLAPEQILCEEVSARTDVYAASVVLWELLTGRRLFDASNEGALIHRVLEGGVAAPSTVMPDVPRRLDALVMRGLARNPTERFASAAELAVALEEELGIAPAHRVAEWLQKTAAQPLAARAAQLAAIERASIRGRAREDAASQKPEWIAADASARTATDAAPLVSAGATPPTADTQLSNVSVVTSAAATAPRRGRRLPAVPVLLAAAAMGGAALIVWGRSDGGGDPSAATTSPEPRAESAAPAEAPAAPSTTVVEVAPTTTVATSPSSSAAAEVVVPEPERPRTAVQQRPRSQPKPAAPPPPPAAPPTAATAAPADDCNPPYVVGADGLRQWKRQCR